MYIYNIYGACGLYFWICIPFATARMLWTLAWKLCMKNPVTKDAKPWRSRQQSWNTCINYIYMCILCVWSEMCNGQHSLYTLWYIYIYMCVCACACNLCMCSYLNHPKSVWTCHRNANLFCLVPRRWMLVWRMGIGCCRWPCIRGCIDPQMIWEM